MLRKGLLALFLVIAISAVLLWLNRASVLAHLALNQARANHVDIGPPQNLVWDQGPDELAEIASERPPNVIFILLDDLGYNDISTFGGGVANGQVPTPNIDRLAASGAIYTQAYSGTGTCAPSRAMLMTGRYPTRTGFEFTPTPDGMSRVISTIANAQDERPLPNIVPNRATVDAPLAYEDQGLPGSEVTVAELLKEQGYHTVHIGKWHLGRRTDFMPNAQGFDESLLMQSGLYLSENDPNVVNAKLGSDPIDRFLWAAMQHAASFNGGEPFEPGGYITDWWTDESLKVIEANKNRPFFLYLAHWGPHTPLQATREDYEAVGDIEPHRLRVYAAMIRALDRSVGRVLDKLEEEGLAENTIVVLSSDNGGAGYIDVPEVNAPFRGWKITLFEGGIRVPMFIKWPQRIAPGTVIDTPVAHIDLLPTLAAAAGAPLPTDRIIDGRDILVEATGEGLIERPNDAIFWQSGSYQVVRAGDWKLQVDRRQDKTWLYDLATDPTEQNNLAEVRSEKAAELLAILDAHMADSVGPLYPHTLTSPIVIDKTLTQPIDADDEYVLWQN
ncbi:MAG: sulfatase-like hydrolase/transferase [Pseudomonadota bacterium]